MLLSSYLCIPLAGKITFINWIESPFNYSNNVRSLFFVKWSLDRYESLSHGWWQWQTWPTATDGPSLYLGDAATWESQVPPPHLTSGLHHLDLIIFWTGIKGSVYSTSVTVNTPRLNILHDKNYCQYSLAPDWIMARSVNEQHVTVLDLYPDIKCRLFICLCCIMSQLTWVRPNTWLERIIVTFDHRILTHSSLHKRVIEPDVKKWLVHQGRCGHYDLWLWPQIWSVHPSLKVSLKPLPSPCIVCLFLVPAEYLRSSSQISTVNGPYIMHHHVLHSLREAERSLWEKSSVWECVILQMSSLSTHRSLGAAVTTTARVAVDTTLSKCFYHIWGASLEAGLSYYKRSQRLWPFVIKISSISSPS